MKLVQMDATHVRCRAPPPKDSNLLALICVPLFFLFPLSSPLLFSLYFAKAHARGDKGAMPLDSSVVGNPRGLFFQQESMRGKLM